MVKDFVYNCCISGYILIFFNWDEFIVGKKEGIGILGSCFGGVMLWGMILICEENYD